MLVVPALVGPMILYRFMQSIVWPYTNPFRPHIFIFLSYAWHLQLQPPTYYCTTCLSQLSVLLITTIHHTSYFVPHFHRTTTTMHKNESSLRKHLIISIAEMIL